MQCSTHGMRLTNHFARLLAALCGYVRASADCGGGEAADCSLSLSLSASSLIQQVLVIMMHLGGLAALAELEHVL